MLYVDTEHLMSLQRLFNYISGQNEAQLKMKMTAPVREHVLQSGAEIEDDITVSFFLPFAYQVGRPFSTLLHTHPILKLKKLNKFRLL